MGLREQKKEQTRNRLSATAWSLAADRGFDHVTVAEIARTAEVSEATLFNYFRTKEDLFYAPLESFGDQLVDAVRTRAGGTSALAAVRDFLLRDRGLLGPHEPSPKEALARLQTRMRVINDSPALLVREQRAFARYTEDLAGVLAAEADDDPVIAAVVAHALIGVHRSLVDLVRRQALAGVSLRRIAEHVREHGGRAFALLESGLERYGIAG